MKDCEKILNEMYWRMKVMVEEKEKGRDDLDEYGLSDDVWDFYGYGVFEELMNEWYNDSWGRDYRDVLLESIGYDDSWGRDYRDVLLDFIEYIGKSVLWSREKEILLVGRWWLDFLMDMDEESGLRLDSMIFDLINVYKGSEEV